MRISLKIFGAFLLIIAMGVSLVIIRTAAVNQMLDKIDYQQELIIKAEAFTEVEDLQNTLQEIHALSEEVIADGNSSSMIVVIIAVSMIVACFATATILSWWIGKKIFWYEGILDNIPYPLSITDNKRAWLFVNKPVEQMLGVKRSEVFGKQCYNWGAGICNTEECGINCLERGKISTLFNQAGMDFKVDVRYLIDKNQKKVGHIEIVQDMTDFFKTQKAQAELVEGIRRSVGSFSDAANQIATMSEQVARDSNENAQALSVSVATHSQKGNKQMEDMLQVMSEINEASGNIEKILNLMNDIARQTNILALNASVESAKAGQYGASFAVVAEEVRNLASKSTDAAKNTGVLVSTSMEKAAEGAQIAGEMSESLRDIVDGFNKSAQIVSDISRINEEQAAALNEIETNVKALEDLIAQFDSRDGRF